MAKFCGEVGFAETREDVKGVWTEHITPRTYFGDIVRNTKRSENGEGLNSNLNINNSISIVSDAYAQTHFFAIRYVKWQGVRWVVSSVEVQHPRLILSIGGVYNGPTPED